MQATVSLTRSRPGQNMPQEHCCLLLQELFNPRRLGTRNSSERAAYWSGVQEALPRRSFLDRSQVAEHHLRVERADFGRYGVVELVDIASLQLPKLLPSDAGYDVLLYVN